MKSVIGIHRYLLACSTLALVGTALPAGAANAQTSAPQSAAETSEADAIVVTARRREERLTDVPVAVSAYSPEVLAQKGVGNIQELGTLTPGLNVTSAATGGRNRPAFELRGIFVADALGPQDQAVGIYVNDIYVARQHGTAQAFYDLANVQTLYGPQGTLFGRNSTAGAILVTTARPTDRLETMVSAGFGNFERVSFEGMINVPLGDKARLRVAGIYTDHDGYTTNLRNGSKLDAENYWSVRASLDLAPTETIRNYTTLEYFKSDNNGWSVHTRYYVKPGSTATVSSLATPVPLSSRVATLYGASLPAAIAAVEAAGRYFAYSGRDEFARTQTATLANTTEIDIADGLMLKNIFGYRWVKDAIGHDNDGLPLAITGGRVGQETTVSMTNRQISNELQLQGKLMDDALDFIVGAYYFRERTNEAQKTWTLIDTVAGATSPTINPYISTNVSKSIFGQVTYNLTSQLSLTAGGRYTWDDRRMVWTGAFRNFGLPNQACNFNANFTSSLATCAPVRRSATFKQPTYTVSANYKPTADTLVYVAHRRGYRSGGYNGRALSAFEAVPFSPEKVKDLELGFKGSWNLGGDARLSANLALYKTWYSDIQRSIILSGPTGPTSVIINAAKATIKGLEFDATLQPIRQLSLNVNWGLNDAVHNRFRYAASPTGYIRDVPFGNSKNTVNASATIIPIDTDDSGRVALTGTMSYRDGWYPSTDMPVFVPETRVPARTLFNLNLDWDKIAGSPVSVQLWVKNLTDKTYTIGSLGLVTSLGFATETYGDPRTYGLTMRYRFGR